MAAMAELGRARHGRRLRPAGDLPHRIRAPPACLAHPSPPQATPSCPLGIDSVQGVEALVADGCPKVWVVTSDVLEQQLSHGEGALIWSSKRLVKEIKESEQELDEELKEIRSTSLQGKIFQHKLKPKVVQGFKNLRNQLEEQERKKK